MAKRAKQPNCDCARSIRYAENLKKDLCAECEEKNKIHEARISSLEKKITVFMLLFAVTATLVGKDLMDNAGDAIESAQTLQQKAEKVVKESSETTNEPTVPENNDKDAAKKTFEVPDLNPMTQSSGGGTILPDGFDVNSISPIREMDKSVIPVIQGDTKTLLNSSKPPLGTPPLTEIKSSVPMMPSDMSVTGFVPPTPRGFSENPSKNYYPIPSPGGILLFAVGLGFVGVRPRR